MNTNVEKPSCAGHRPSSLKFKVIPCLSVFHEHDFDPDVIDLFVVLNARAGLGPLYDAINLLPRGADDRFVRSENTIAARAELIFAGFPKSSWRDLKVACGIFAAALKQAALQDCRKIALLVTAEQFRGDLTQLVQALACRAAVFEQAEGEALKLEEIQILCRIEDEERISRGLKPAGKLCTACFADQPTARKQRK